MFSRDKKFPLLDDTNLLRVEHKLKTQRVDSDTIEPENEPELDVVDFMQKREHQNVRS